MQAPVQLLLLCLSCAAVTECQRRSIKQLPRLNLQVNFKQYSGYLTTTNGRRLFYWLVESSEVAPAEAPLVLWLNGGPGCSSIGGLLMTNGPFLANDRAELDRNDLAWNRLANMLYIDSPSGVGLSEPGSSESELNDEFTTQLNLAALLNFFALFPEYRGRPFFATGESYAGIYVPMLAHAIQQSGHYPTLINLKGIGIGNGLHMPHEDTIMIASRTEFLLAMGIAVGNRSFMVQEHNGMSMNYYNVAKPCIKQNSDDTYHCTNSTGLVTYLNDKEVRSALGINESISGRYVICRKSVQFLYTMNNRSVLRELTSLARGNVSVLLYVGTLDYLITATATGRLLEQLPESAKPTAAEMTDWWHYCFRDSGRASLQIGGIQQSYLGGQLRFRTVVGAGHSVPTDRPDMGLQIFADFLSFSSNSAVLPDCKPGGLTYNECSGKGARRLGALHLVWLTALTFRISY